LPICKHNRSADYEDMQKHEMNSDNEICKKKKFLRQDKFRF